MRSAVVFRWFKVTDTGSKIEALNDNEKRCHRWENDHHHSYMNNDKWKKPGAKYILYIRLNYNYQRLSQCLICSDSFFPERMNQNHTCTFSNYFGNKDSPAKPPTIFSNDAFFKGRTVKSIPSEL
jgi:hypothetical protein